MASEFDPTKDATNVEKHGVPLLFGERIFSDPLHLVIPTARPGDEEARFKAIGTIDGKLWTAIHVYRGANVRYISVRRSNDGEHRAYNRA